MSNHERVEAEALERYPDMDWDPYNEEPVDDYGYGETARRGFIAGRTVTAEQVEAAAKVLWGRSPFIEALETTWEGWSRRNPAAAETWRENVRLTLTTAGLLIEGDE